MMKYVCMYVCIYLSTKKGEGVRYGRNIYSDVLEWWRGVSGRRRQRDEWLVSILLFLLLLLLSCKYTPPCLCFHVCFLLALALRGFRNLHFMFLECVNMYVLFIRYISLYLSVCMCIVATPSCHFFFFLKSPSCHFSFFLYISRSIISKTMSLCQNEGCQIFRLSKMVYIPNYKGYSWTIISKFANFKNYTIT